MIHTLANSTPAPLPASNLRWLDYIVLVGYMIVILWIGFAASRKKQDESSYFKASKRIPAWAIGMSVLAAIMSSVTFIAYPGKAFDRNWLFLVQGLMVPVVLLAFIWYIVPIYRDSIGISAYEYFEKRFSYVSRLYTSLAFSVLHFTKLGVVLYLPTLAVAQVTGLRQEWLILIIGGATVLYTMIGGMESVIWTDVFQGFLFLAGGLVSLAILLFKAPGGPHNVISTAWSNGKISFAPYDLDFAKPTFIVLVINGLFYALQKYATDQTVVQRFIVAKDDRSAIKATLIGGLLCVPAWTLFMFVGSCLWAFYRITKLSLPIDPDTGKAIAGDRVFPHFILSQLPVGMTGLVLAALLAAAMATTSANLNCLSAVFVEDYYGRLRPASSDRQRLILGKLFVGITGCLAIGVALLYVAIKQAAILDKVFELYAVFSGGLVGLFALAFLTRRANWQGALIGIIVTIVFSAWGVLCNATTKPHPYINLGRYNFPHDNLMVQVYPNFLIFIVGYVASLFFPPPHLEKEQFTLRGFLAKRRQMATPVLAQPGRAGAE
jgi:SSS family solute:Na+ symporter